MREISLNANSWLARIRTLCIWDRSTSAPCRLRFYRSDLSCSSCNASKQTSETDPCLGILGSLIKVSCGVAEQWQLVKTALWHLLKILKLQIMFLVFAMPLIVRFILHSSFYLCHVKSSKQKKWPIVFFATLQKNFFLLLLNDWFFCDTSKKILEKKLWLLFLFDAKRVDWMSSCSFWTKDWRAFWTKWQPCVKSKNSLSSVL